MVTLAELVAVARLAYEAAARMVGGWEARRRTKALEREIDEAWREALKGGGADLARVEAALDRARLAGPLSASGRRLATALRALKIRAAPVRLRERRPAQKRRSRRARAKRPRRPARNGTGPRAR